MFLRRGVGVGLVFHSIILANDQECTNVFNMTTLYFLRIHRDVIVVWNSLVEKRKNVQTRGNLVIGSVNGQKWIIVCLYFPSWNSVAIILGSHFQIWHFLISWSDLGEWMDIHQQEKQLKDIKSILNKFQERGFVCESNYAVLKWLPPNRISELWSRSYYTAQT